MEIMHVEENTNIMDNVDEIFLIKSSQSGDIDSFEKLIESHKQRVYGIALKMTKNREDALDASQDALIKVYRSIGKFSFKSSFSTWLYRIVVNCCIDHIKKQKKLVLIQGGDEDGRENIIDRIEEKDTPESILEKKIKKQEIKRAFDELEEEFKTVVILRDIEGFSYDEIARINDISLGTVKSRISRGRKKLRDIIIRNREGGNGGEM